MVVIAAVWIIIKDKINAVELMDHVLSTLNTHFNYEDISNQLREICQQITRAKNALIEAQKLFKGANKKAQSLRRKLHKALAKSVQAPNLVKDNIHYIILYHISMNFSLYYG